METKATLEAVKDAVDGLLARGEKVTSQAVLDITGGSKTVVLKHMGTVRGQLGSWPEAIDPEISRLQDFAVPMVRDIWRLAKRQAEAEFQSRLRLLVDLQSGATEDLDTLRVECDELRAELEDHRTKALVAEQRLEAEASKQGQLDRMLAMIEKMQPDQAKYRGKSDATTMETVLRVFEGATEPLTRQQVDKVLLPANGNNARKANQARLHAMDSGYLGLCLTAKGKARLAEVSVSDHGQRKAG